MAKSAEFILEFEAKQILVLEPFGPYYEEAIRRFSEQPDLQLVESPSLRELGVLARQVGVCIVLAHCPDEAAAPDFVDLLQACRKEIRERKVRVVITVSKDFLFLQTRFVREGATEVIQQPISPKLLYTKLDRYLGIIPSRNKYGKLLPAKSRQHGTGDDLPNEPQITWQVPLEIPSDCWTTIEGRTRWVQGANKWTVTLIGPPPQYGEWTPSERVPGPVPPTEEPTWEWIPKGLTDDPFVMDDGAWKFRGEKPEFKEGAWVFTGEYPRLVFVRDDDDRGAKVAGDQTELHVAENSEHALEAAKLIEDALRENARVTAENEDGSESEVTAEGTRATASDADSREDVAGEIPEYLRRESRAERKKPVDLGETLTVSPLALALFVSEMIQSRRFAAEKMLSRACEHLREASGGAEVEFWLRKPNGWKCVQHGDLMDMALQQKLENASPYERSIRAGDYRAAVIAKGSDRVAALVIGRGKAEYFTDSQLEGFAKAMLGIVMGLSEEASAA